MWINEILKKNKKILALSPMADMTDSPFCKIVRKIGGVDVVFREMVSSEAVVRKNAKTLLMTDIDNEERPVVQQIFGADPATMAHAAVMIIERSNPDGIDINMGCPANKITSNFNGCALMKDPALSATIIREVKNAIGKTPLSVKIRLGWSDSDEFKKFIPVIEDAGADLIAIHGRTKVQGYSGKSDWTRIGVAKQIAGVPILANGDIHEPWQVGEALKITGADGVLIARGALGNPWFFRQILNNAVVSIKERVQVVLEHARLHIARYGDRGIISFRKHLSWYFKKSRISLDVVGIKELREKLVRVSSFQELEEILSIFQE